MWELKPELKFQLPTPPSCAPQFIFSGNIMSGGKKLHVFFISPMKAPHYSHFLFVFSSILRLFLTSLLLCHFEEAKTNNKMFSDCETCTINHMPQKISTWSWFKSCGSPCSQMIHHFSITITSSTIIFPPATHLHSSACLEATCSHLGTSSDTSPGRWRTRGRTASLLCPLLLGTLHTH